MAFTLEEFNGMEMMWEQLPKRPDENHVIISEYDIDSMWQTGIVDTVQFPIEAWRASFDSNKQPDGNFIVSKEEFLAKEKYRYKGEIMVPFDAMLINEGLYTDEGLSELFDASIAPSCSLSANDLKKFLDNFKKAYRDAGSNLINMKAEQKVKIRELLDIYPSPLRRLELIFDYLITQPDKAAAEPPPDFKDPTYKTNYSLSPRQLARAQASSFSLRPTNVAAEKWEALNMIQRKSAKKTVPGAPEDKKTSGVSLQKVKRSRKGMRG